MLSLLHHPNLVNLIGYCADGDQRLLVYEFICLWDPWKITFMLCFFQCFAYLTHDYCYEFLILLFHYFQGSFRYPSILPFSIIILDELHINYKTQYNNMAWTYLQIVASSIKSSLAMVGMFSCSFPFKCILSLSMVTPIEW